MKKYEWIEDCIKGRQEGVTFKELAKRHGTTTGAISAALWRHRNGFSDYGNRWSTFAELRLTKILDERRRAVDGILSSMGETVEPSHLKMLEAWARGCTYEECAAEAGCSRTWANIVLRQIYGLDTSQRFRRETLKRVQAAKTEGG